MAEPMLCVCWRDHTSELATVYKSLLENNFLVDCTLSAEGQNLKAHRLVLSACSPYFQMVFQEETGKHPFIIFLNASFETLKAVIDFVYRGQTQIPEGNLKAFLRLAQSLQIKGLNAFSQDKNKNLCRNTAGNVSCGPSEDNEDTCVVQCISASQKDSPENSSQHHPDHSDRFLDSVHTHSSVSFEAFNALSDEVQSESVITPHTPVRDNEVSENVEITVKEEPLFSALSETVNKRLDNVKRNETLSANFISGTDGRTSFLFGERDLNQQSSSGVTSLGNVESSVITHSQQQLMQLSDEVASRRDVQQHKPLPPVILVPKTEQMDDAISGEPLDDYIVPGNHTNETNEGTEPAYGERNLNQCSGADGLPLEEELATQRRCLAGQQSESSPPHTELQSHEGRHAHPGEQTLPSDEGATAWAHAPINSTQKPRRPGPKPHVCQVCQRAFAAVSLLAIHERTHTGERPHRCGVCGKGFAQSSTLVTHMRRHTGERPYTCEVCSMAFARSSTLTVHRRRHTGESPYRCDLCGKNFRHTKSLDIHKRCHLQ